MKSVFCGLLLTLFISGTVMAAEPKVFSDEDLKGYKAGPTTGMDAEDLDTAPDLSEDREKYKSDTEKEEWCRRAAAAEERINKAVEDVSAAERRKTTVFRKFFRGTHIMPADEHERAQSDVDEAEAEVFSARKAKEDLEAEAHQKRIPPGWLRCQ